MLERTLYVASDGKAVAKQVPVKDLEPSEVRVKVHSVGINPVDWKTIDFRLADGTGQGNDFAGTVIDVGSAVTSTKVGDTVAGGVGGGNVRNMENGAFTDILTIEEHLLLKFPYKLRPASTGEIPIGLPETFEQAASLGIVVETNVMAFENHQNPGPNDYALIYGVTSALGFTAAQFALVHGWNVIGVSSPLPELTKELGDDIHLLDRNDPNWVEKAKEIADDRIVFGFDTICLGNSENMVFSTLSTEVPSFAAYSFPGKMADESHRAANPKATLEAPLYFFLMQQDKVLGLLQVPNETKPHQRAAELVGKINDLLRSRLIKTLPVKVLDGLESIPEGLCMSRRGVRGTKIVVRVDGPKGGATPEPSSASPAAETSSDGVRPDEEGRGESAAAAAPDAATPDAAPEKAQTGGDKGDVRA